MHGLSINQLLMIKKLARYFIIGIVGLNLALWIIPREVDTEKNNQIAAIGNDTFFVISPNGKLVGWGTNEDGEIGGAMLLPYYPYIMRKIILKDAASVYAGSKCAMALDKKGVLWGWGMNNDLLLTDKHPINNKPIKIMDGIISADLRETLAAAVKCDGTLWMWGPDRVKGSLEGFRDSMNTDKSIHFQPQKVMNDVKEVYFVGSVVFVIRNNNDLYYTGRGYSSFWPVFLAEDVKSVAMTRYSERINDQWNYIEAYQYLSIKGEVFSFDLDDALSEVVRESYYCADKLIATDVRLLFSNGFIKNNNSLWIWDSDSGDYKNIKDNIAYAYSDFYITTNGNIHRASGSSWLHALPYSVNTIFPILRNILIYGIIALFIIKKFILKRHLKSTSSTPVGQSDVSNHD